jgi:hypothetical protein
VTAPLRPVAAVHKPTLAAAADLIERAGWCQGRMGAYRDYEPEGPCCVVGALVRVRAPGAALYPADALAEALERSPINWNDSLPPGDPGKRIVIATLRELAR